MRAPQDPLRAALVDLLGEVGFMRSCIASGEKLSTTDLDRQNKAMSRAASLLAASPAPDPGAGLREAAKAVLSQAEPDDDFEGQFVDYLVPAPALDALRAALAPSAEPPETA